MSTIEQTQTYDKSNMLCRKQCALQKQIHEK